MRIPFAVGRMKDRFAEIVLVDSDTALDKVRSWPQVTPAPPLPRLVGERPN